jgi:hypothetical protein
MQPTWNRGALYYPRNDDEEDGLGNRTLVEPHTGNVLLGYARLNVHDGLFSLYNDPLPHSFFSTPALTEVDPDIDLHSALFRDNALRFRMALRDTGAGEVMVGRIAGYGAWTLECDGQVVARGQGNTLESSTSGHIVAAREGLVVRCPPHCVHDFEMRFA